ncbi:MAG: 4-hydroxy-3-methylbut-2-enyl diphosphate reductase [Coriobacteriaceae bacterium]|nr:4-hydroxy-3-methylbut-2-enyl diphosphate reductase [Coriobacteriaceae bacterium]
MNVILAEHAGACYGVQRALDMAYEAAGRQGGVSTLGQLIHNPGAVAALEAQGVNVAASLDDVSGGTVIVRSHGVTPDVYESIAERGFDVVDATCPHVARAQKAAADLAGEGCRVIVVGEAGHPEVEGLRAYAERAGANVDVVPSPEDVPAGLQPPVGIVVQTTQRRENLEAVVEAVRAQGVEPIVKRTICSATTRRQDAAAKLAGQVDAMVVIGGRNSSNTTRLAEICAAGCARSFHIESADEIDPSWLEGCETVGVTAGASTPEDQISAVTARLEAL